MKIGFIFDVKEDYGISDGNNEYMDFSHKEDIAEIAKELKLLGHQTILIGNIKKFLELGSYDFDIIFNISEGFKTRNREGIVPSVLELLNIPYIGSDAYTLSLSLNKYHSKLLVENLHVPTPNSIIINDYNSESDNIESWIKKNNLNFPIIAKTNYEGNSTGVILNNRFTTLKKSVKKLLGTYNAPTLCEEFINGKEITVPIVKVGDSYIIEVIEFIYQGEPISFYDLKLKQSSDVVALIADIDQDTRKEIINDSIKIFEAFQCFDYARIDYKLNENGHYFLEVNPIPELTSISSFSVLASENDMSYGQLLDKIVQTSCRRQNI